MGFITGYCNTYNLNNLVKKYNDLKLYYDNPESYRSTGFPSHTECNSMFNCAPMKKSYNTKAKDIIGRTKLVAQANHNETAPPKEQKSSNIVQDQIINNNATA